MKKILSTLLVLNSLIIYSQAPVIQWQKSFGGGLEDYGNCVLQTSDGGYIVAGGSASSNGDVTGSHGPYDGWILKLSSTGSVQWKKAYGGSASDYFQSIQQTPDGGYIVAGYEGSVNGQVTGNIWGYDYWVLKLSSTGDIQWQKSLGGMGYDFGYSIQQISGGGYIVCGTSYSNDVNATFNHGQEDYWVVKLSSTGDIVWQKSLGGSQNEEAWSIIQSSDKGFVVAGWTRSDDGDIVGSHGQQDYWVVKLDSSGTLQWQKALGGTGNDYAKTVLEAADGGYLVVGSSDSNDGDVSGNHGDFDNWVVKLSASGSVLWQQTYGGSAADAGESIAKTSDQGYVVAGYSASTDVEQSSNHGGFDYWILKITNLGTVQWQSSFGGSGSDEAHSIQQTTDGGYIVAGTSASNDIDVSGNHGGYDYWVVKLEIPLGVNENKSIQPISVFPNPSTGQFNFMNLAMTSSLGKENTIDIYDVVGQLIYTTNSSDSFYTIDLSDKDKGAYFYKIYNSSKIIQQGKIILK